MPRRARWASRTLLQPLVRRFAVLGLDVTFDAPFVGWLVEHIPEDGEAPDAFVDRVVTPALVASLPRAATGR